MNTVNDGPKLGNTPEQSNHSGFAIASVIDNEYFGMHRDSKTYKRDVIPGEVPSSLRSKDIRKVRVGLIADGLILYEFDNKCGDAVWYSLSFANALLSTDEGRNQASFCLKLLDSLASLGSEDA